MKNKKRNIIIAISLTIVAIIATVVATVLVLNHNKEQAIKKAEIAYIANVNDFNEQVSSSGIKLESIQTKISKNWYDSIYKDKHGGSIDKAFENALVDKAKDIAAVYKEKISIDELYLKTKRLPDNISENEDLEEIETIVKDVYNDYIKMHTIVLDPSGKNYSQYNESANTVDDSLATNLTNLSNLLK